MRVYILVYVLTEDGGSIISCENDEKKIALFGCLVTSKMAATARILVKIE